MLVISTPARCVTSALLLVSLGVLTGCRAEPAPLTKFVEPVSEAFVRYCALCHGERGEGAVADHANAITNPFFLQSVSDDFLFQSIRRGRPGTPMSAFSEAAGGPLSDAEIRELVTFLRGFQLPAGKRGLVTQTPADESRAARARPLFQSRCASCHGARGEGREGPSLNNPVFHELASDQLLTRAITGGRPGTPMPAFGEQLTETEVEDLAHLLRTFAVPLTPAAPTQPGRLEGWATDDSIPVVLNPDGGAPHFAPANGYVPAEQVKFALEQGRRMILLDARAVPDWRALHLPGALPAPFYDDPQALTRVPVDGTQIVVYCACPHVAADRLAATLRELGHTSVAVIEEGLYFWRDQGFPLVSEPDPPPPDPTPGPDAGAAAPVDAGVAE